MTLDSTDNLVNSEVIFSYKRENLDANWQCPFIVSPDGRFVFTIDRLTCCLIEIEENKVIWTNEKIFGDHPVCFFSEDGSKIIINDPIIVLKSESGEEIFRLPKERPGYSAISRNGKFAVALYHGTLTYWNIESRKVIASFPQSSLFEENDEVKEKEKSSYSLSICPSGRYLVVKKSTPTIGYRHEYQNYYYDLQNIENDKFPDSNAFPDHLNGIIDFSRNSDLLLVSNVNSGREFSGFSILVASFPSLVAPKKDLLVGCQGSYSFSSNGKYVAWIDGFGEILLRCIETGETTALGKINSFLKFAGIKFSSDMLSLFVTTNGIPMMTKNRYTERTTVKFIDVFVSRWDVSEYTQPGEGKSATFPEVVGQTS